MKFTDVIVLAVVMVIFFSVFSAQLGSIRCLDAEIEKKLMQRDSTIFISKSFCGMLEEKGFSDFEEWKKVCRAMWKLENIEYEYSEKSGVKLCRGKWSGPYGNGEVYYRKSN